MNIAKITTPISQALGKATNNTKSKFAQNFSKGFNFLEPNKGDNSFCGLATIMGLFVVIPRIKTALKRNPDNKARLQQGDLYICVIISFFCSDEKDILFSFIKFLFLLLI